MARLLRMRNVLVLGLVVASLLAGCNEILAINPPADELLILDSGLQEQDLGDAAAALANQDADGGM